VARASLPTLLVVDDQPKAAELLARKAPDLALLAVDERPYARSWTEVSRLLAQARRPPDLVVLDLKFELPDEELLPDQRPLGDGADARRERRERRDKQGLLILERLRRSWPDLPVVLTTAHEEIPFEDEARRLKADAFTYTAGEDETTGDGLVRLVRRVLKEREAPALSGRFFWGKSAQMREVRRRIAGLAPTAMPLLVTGPTGTGKNLLAREVIHPASGRKGAYLAFDCATVPESLLASALFGALRGAYTGAVADRAGVFEAAANGTLFLDEVENLTPDAQKALLSALNDGVVRRLGALAETPHSARMVAASNTDLRARAGEGTFRTDLLMRLNPALALELPPLKDRRDDLPELRTVVAQRFFADPAHRARVTAEIRAVGARAAIEADEDGELRLALVASDEDREAGRAEVLFELPRKAWQAMARHPWPGNIRQFEMVVADLLAASLYAGGGAAVDERGRAHFTVDPRFVFDLLAEAGRETAAAEPRLTIPMVPAPSVEDFRREVERSVLRQLFQETKGDFALMAERMTGSRAEARAVRLRFNRLGLSVRRER